MIVLDYHGLRLPSTGMLKPVKTKDFWDSTALALLCNRDKVGSALLLSLPAITMWIMMKRIRFAIFIGL
jgi:hypothetical protein